MKYILPIIVRVQVIAIESSVDMVVGMQVSHNDCYGSETGTIIAIVSAGAGGYVYALNDEQFQTQNAFANLAAGDYLLLIQDIEGCLTTQNFAITQPSPLLSTF